MSQPKTRFLESPHPRILGHRGAKGHAPENTIASFRKGIELGATILEMDVHATRDGTVVVSHDERVDRTTNGSGAIRRMMHSEVAKLDAGYRWSPDDKTYPYRGQGLRVPTLLEVIGSFPDTPLNIEIKQSDPPMVDLVVGLLRERGCEERTNLAAESTEVMGDIRASGWTGATGYCMGDVLAFIDVLANGRFDEYVPPGIALQVPERWGDNRVVTEEFVKGAKKCGVEVHVWTVNDPADMARLFTLGVDGLVTDFPERACATIAQLKRS